MTSAVPTPEEEARRLAERAAELRGTRRDEFGCRLDFPERLRLLELHFMHCPKCGRVLKEVEAYGTCIDICPGCQGLWLDRGELEHILDRAGGLMGFFRSLFGDAKAQ
jgi:hypothetical protein